MDSSPPNKRDGQGNFSRFIAGQRSEASDFRACQPPSLNLNCWTGAGFLVAAGA
jgi:hypothetical protein